MTLAYLIPFQCLKNTLIKIRLLKTKMITRITVWHNIATEFSHHHFLLIFLCETITCYTQYLGCTTGWLLVRLSKWPPRMFDLFLAPERNYNKPFWGESGKHFGNFPKLLLNKLCYRKLPPLFIITVVPIFNGTCCVWTMDPLDPKLERYNFKRMWIFLHTLIMFEW